MNEPKKVLSVGKMVIHAQGIWQKIIPNFQKCRQIRSWEPYAKNPVKHQ